MIRAVFFDLDDTLCQTSPTREPRARLAHEALMAAGHELDFDAFYAAILEYDPAIKFIRGMNSVLKEHGLHETEAGLLASKLWLFQGCEHLVQPYEGLLDLLTALAGVQKLGVITNGPIVPQTIKFEALKFVEHFHPDLFVTSEHAGCFKPDERIFRYALERAGVEPHEAIHIGDSPGGRRRRSTRRRHARGLVQPRRPRASRRHRAGRNHLELYRAGSADQEVV